jgi:death-on-curing protein
MRWSHFTGWWLTSREAPEGFVTSRALASAVAQPRMTFDGRDLYPTRFEQAAAIGFSLVGNQPFVDGNKRIGHAAMEKFLLLNGLELLATVDEPEMIVLGVAEGSVKRFAFTEWVRSHIRSVT